MLEIIKDKLFASQPDYSDRIVDETKYLDLNAGAALLESYKVKWESLHSASESIVKEAERVENLTKHIFMRLDEQWKVLTEINSYLNLIPDIAKDLNATIKTMATVGGSFEELEKSLADLENTIEVEELQRKLRSEQVNLTVYTEKRAKDHVQLKSVLWSRHNLKVEEMKRKQQMLLSERQETFQQAFQHDVQHYVKYGKVEKVEGIRESELKLEDVNIDEDEDELGAFLADDDGQETVTADKITAARPISDSFSA